MPASRAARTTAREPSGNSVAVPDLPRLLQPRPMAETLRPERPTVRKSMHPSSTARLSAPDSPTSDIRQSASQPRVTVEACSHRHPPRSSSAEWTVRWRSEEHTSELQSRQYLVCRLLLEQQNSWQ